MATEDDNVNSGALGTLVAVGTVAFFGIALVVTALVRSEMAEEAEKKEVSADRPYRDLVAEQTAKLSAPAAYVNRGTGLVSLPIDRAMELVVAGLKKDPNSATPPTPPGTKPDEPPADPAAAPAGSAAPAAEGAPAEGAAPKEEAKPADGEKKGEAAKDGDKKDPEKPGDKKDAEKKETPKPKPAPAAPAAAPAAPAPAPAAPAPAPNGQ